MTFPPGHANASAPDAARPGDDPDETPSPLPALDDLTAEARSRLIHFIVTSALGGGVAPTAVIALYTDLADDPLAVRYADRRYVLRDVPPDWRDVEDRVLDLAQAAAARGVDLASAWGRATGIAMRAEDPLEQLARLAGTPANTARTPRSIFDDPEDLDALEDDTEGNIQHAPLSDRLPDLVDLTVDAQVRIQRFAIEERLERGLPAVEVLELYRTFEVAGDERAHQYLDRVFVTRESPVDWQELQAEAQRALELADYRGRDAGRMYADIFRASPSLDPRIALRLVIERLQ